MRHFQFLTEQETNDVFHLAPEELNPRALTRNQLAMSLGATLYAPGTRTDLDVAARKVASYGTTSMVWCLEDAIPHDSVPEATNNIITALKRLHSDGDSNHPLIFIRVRSYEQIRPILDALGPAAASLTGFSTPKVDALSAEWYLDTISTEAEKRGLRLYAMPILETAEVAYNATRRGFLQELNKAFSRYSETTLCVRFGGTDLSGLFGLRRDRDTTVWDVAVVRDMLADIINEFSIHGHNIVTGAVWEHIPGPRLFRPLLRSTPFHESNQTSLRRNIVANDVDALIREIHLDKNNGIVGKTVIHPTHVPVVNAMYTVTREEYDDALAIREGADNGGVIASAHGRMNEMGPHALWASLTLDRARVYGVINSDEALVELLALGQQAVTTKKN